MQTLFSRIMPFIVLGIMLVVLIAGFILFSYLLVFGAILGLVLFMGAWLKEKFFPSQKISAIIKRGRTIDHDDFK